MVRLLFSVPLPSQYQHVSVSWRPSEAFRFIAGAGGRTGAAWTGFNVESGNSFSGSVAFEYHDARDPWTIRFGLGLERQNDVPEDEAGMIGLGFGWNFGGVLLDLGILHRSISRDPEPTSYEDRLAISASAGF